MHSTSVDQGLASHLTMTVTTERDLSLILKKPPTCRVVNIKTKSICFISLGVMASQRSIRSSNLKKIHNVILFVIFEINSKSHRFMKTSKLSSA